MRFLFFLLVLLLALPAAAGSVDSGVAPYERCALCHGLFGNTDRTKFPKLAGQNPLYLEQQIQHFIAGRRTNDGGQMATVVTEIDESQIPEIVEWFSSQEPPEPLNTFDQEGQALYLSAGCAGCHVEPVAPGQALPLLSAQHPEYLAKQMRELRDGARSGDDEGLMQNQLQTWSDDNIDAVARYLSSLQRPS